MGDNLVYAGVVLLLSSSSLSEMLFSLPVSVANPPDTINAFKKIQRGSLTRFFLKSRRCLRLRRASYKLTIESAAIFMTKSEISVRGNDGFSLRRGLGSDFTTLFEDSQ